MAGCFPERERERRERRGERDGERERQSALHSVVLASTNSSLNVLSMCPPLQSNLHVAMSHKREDHVVVITGANGTNGAEVAKHLHKHHSHKVVKLLLRDPAKLPADIAHYGQVVKGDLADPASLDAAFAGAHSLFLLVPFVENAQVLTKNAVEAAKKAGVGHIVKFSSIGATKESALWVVRDHAIQEDIVKASGVPYTILQPTFFQSNLIAFNRPTLEKDGVFFGSSGGDAKYTPIDPADTGAVAAKILTDGSAHHGETYVLTGGEALSDHEIAALATAAWGRSIRYQDVDPEAYRKMLDSFGLPAWQAESLHGLQQIIRAGYSKDISPVVEKLLGRKPGTMQNYLTTHKL